MKRDDLEAAESVMEYLRQEARQQAIHGHQPAHPVRGAAPFDAVSGPEERAALAAQLREETRAARIKAATHEKPRLDMVESTPQPWPPARLR